uniref:Caspase recruitment domain-containing protein n=1 Tax=Ciona intestinalis TaxID=7719 RepID=F6ZS15_CIOIN
MEEVERNGCLRHKLNKKQLIDLRETVKKKLKQPRVRHAFANRMDSETVLNFLGDIFPQGQKEKIQRDLDNHGRSKAAHGIMDNIHRFDNWLFPLLDSLAECKQIDLAKLLFSDYIEPVDETECVEFQYSTEHVINNLSSEVESLSLNSSNNSNPWNGIKENNPMSFPLSFPTAEFSVVSQKPGFLTNLPIAQTGDVEFSLT